MIRDIKWAYELGFKRGWKVGNRRGRERKSGGEVDKTTTDQISCDTESAKERKPETYAEYLWREQTEELKFNDLETEVEHSEIRASATSDVLPTNECRHARWGYVWDGEDFVGIEHFYCPKCGEKL